MKTPTKRIMCSLAASIAIAFASAPGGAAESHSTSVPFSPPVKAGSFCAVSPDGLNELRLDVGEKGMTYSVLRRGKAIVKPTRFYLSVEELKVRLASGGGFAAHFVPMEK